jgi:hypothetical protein
VVIGIEETHVEIAHLAVLVTEKEKLRVLLPVSQEAAQTLSVSPQK